MPYLVGASPIGFVVLQHALPQHGHHLREGFVGEGGVGQLLHEGSCGPPGVIVGGLPYLALRFRVVHHDIGAARGFGVG